MARLRNPSEVPRKPKPTATRMVLGTKGNVEDVLDTYATKRRADRGRTYALRCGLRHEYDTRANGCSGMYARTDCRVFRKPTAQDLADHEMAVARAMAEAEKLVQEKARQDAELIAYRACFTPEQLQWMDDRQRVRGLRCFAMRWYPTRRPQPSPEEITFLMSLSEKDETGWLVYADWLDDHDETAAATKIRSHINYLTGRRRQTRAEGHAGVDVSDSAGTAVVSGMSAL